MNPGIDPRVVDDHRLGRLLDLDILADFQIMVDRVQNHNRQLNMSDFAFIFPNLIELLGPGQEP